MLYMKVVKRIIATGKKKTLPGIEASLPGTGSQMVVTEVWLEGGWRDLDNHPGRVRLKLTGLWPVSRSKWMGPTSGNTEEVGEAANEQRLRRAHLGLQPRLTGIGSLALEQRFPVALSQAGQGRAWAAEMLQGQVHTPSWVPNLLKSLGKGGDVPVGLSNH